MSCFIIKKNSKLKEDLIKHYSDNVKGTSIYNALASDNILGEASFEKWLQSQEDYMTYDNGEPNIETFLEWEKYLNHYNRINKVFSTPTFQSTAIEFLGLSKGYTVQILDNLYEMGMGPINLFEPEINGININNLFNKSLNDIISTMKKNDALPEMIEALEEYPKNFIESYKTYLKAVLNIDVNSDEMLTDALEENDNKETKDTAFDKSSNEFSPVDNAPNVIKILFFSLKNGETSEVGLPDTIDYKKIFNYVQEELSSVPADIKLFINKLNELSKNYPELKELISRLNFGKEKYYPSSDSQTYFREQQLRTAFVNQFNQTKLEYSLHIKREDGTIGIVNSNLDRIENLILSEWQSNFEKIQSNNPDIIGDIKEAKRLGENWIGFLGIDVEQDQIGSVVKNAIYNFGINKRNKISDLYTDKKGVRSQLATIARMKAAKNAETTNHQHFNTENKIIYGITLNTYLSTLTKDFAYYAGDVAKLSELYPEIYNSPYSLSSDWLTWINQGEEIQIGAYDGFKSETTGVGKITKNLQETDINVQRVTGMLMEGKYPLMRSADRTIENYFSFKGKRKRNGLIVNSVDEAKSYLLRHLEGELGAMFDTANIAYYKENNKKSRIFYIDNKGKRQSIFEYVYPNDSVEDAVAKMSTEENPKVDEFIGIMVDQMLEKESAYLDSHRVMDYLDEVVELYGSEKLVTDLFILNSYIGNLEQSKLFVGDPAMFKNSADIFKRISMMNSNKNPARIDPEMDVFLNSLEHKQTGKTNITSKINTITINDVESTASEINAEFETLLKDIFGNDYGKYQKVYDAINEGDGFAYMTYDEYRIAANRFNEWSESDENLYQELTQPNLTKAQIYEKYSELMRNVTPKKFQYTGKIEIADNNVNAIAGRKFSVIPLVPGLAPKGTVLDKMLSDMIDNNNDMLFFKSAAKFGMYNDLQDMYDSSGNYVLDMSKDKEVLDYKYMGNQMKINNKAKTKITASSQKRKILMTNFYKNGVPITEEIGGLIDEYVELQSKIVNKEYAGLEKQLKDNDTGDVDMDKLVNMLITTGIQQGYTTNELKSLDFLKEVPVLDALPNKLKVESLITAKLRKVVIASKRRGNSAAQVPDIGFEVNEETAAHSERHNLSFYRMSKDKSTLLPMEIMVALPADLVNYVRIVHGNGKYTQEALDDFNRTIEEDNVEFEKNGKVSELGKILTYVGFRIPNQAVSSSDVARVKRFLPPYAANMVVVPKAIVAKTGSDFDIDKLNLYKPDYRVNYSNYDNIVKGFVNNVPKQVVLKSLRDYGIEFDVNAKQAELNRLFVEELMESDIELNNSALEITRSVYNDMLKFSGIADGIVFKDSLENELLEKEIEITLHEANRKQLLKPLTNLMILDIVDEITGLRGETAESNDLSQIFLNSTNVDKFIAFLSGKGGVGQVAIHITNHVLAQKAGLKMKALHNYFDNKSEIELGRTENDADQDIAEILSEMLTSYVDIAKDPYILDLNAINSTANTILMMLRWGMKPNVVFKFINQPIIKDYVKEQAFNESIVNEGTEQKLNRWDDKRGNQGLIMKVISKYNSSISQKDLISWNQEKYLKSDGQEGQILEDVYDMITEQELNEGIKKNKQDATQVKFLDLFIEYQRQSKIFQKMISSTSPDTKGFKNFTTLENQLNERIEVEESEMFVNYDKMFDGFIGEFQKSKEDFKNTIAKLYISQMPEYKSAMDELKKLYVDSVRGVDKKQSAIDKIEGEFIQYILSQTELDFNKEASKLFEGKTSIPKVFQRIQKDFKTNGEVNPFVELMIPIINNDDLGIDSLKPSVKKLSNFEKETMVAYFKDLEYFDSDIKDVTGVENFYKKLIAFQMIQAGINNSPYSFASFIPALDYHQLIKHSIRKALNGDIDIHGFASIEGNDLGQYVRNNPSPLYNSFSAEKDFMVKYVGNKKFIFKSGRNRTSQLGMKPFFNIYGKTPLQQEIDENTPEIKKRTYYELTNDEVTEIDPALEKQMVDIIEAIGGEVQMLDNLVDENGETINAVAKADLLSGIIQVAKGKRGTSTLPEEAVHLVLAALGKNHPLVKKMMNDIVNFEVYNEVKKEYADTYNSEEEFRFEAVGKLVSQHIIKGEPLGNYERDIAKSWWQKVLLILNRLFNGVQTEKLDTTIDAFKATADLFLNKKILEQTQPVKYSRDGIKKLAVEYNMSEAGFIKPEGLIIEHLKARARKLDITIATSESGNYYFKRRGSKLNPFTNNEFFQLKVRTQPEIVKQLRDDNAKVSPKKVLVADKNGIMRERYVFDGETYENRVSDLQADRFNKNKTKEQILESMNDPDNIISREMGTELHDVSDDFLKIAVNAKPNMKLAAGVTVPTKEPKGNAAVSTPKIQKLGTAINALANEIGKTQQSIDPNADAIVITENFVQDPKKRIGGSQDVLVIYSDGSASIYDYKFIEFNKKKVNGKWKLSPEEEIPFVKRQSYELQISEYKRILKEVYGIKQFRQSRILPIAVQYNRKNGKKQKNLKTLEAFSLESDKAYLIPLPVANELTESKKINKILDSLFRKEEILSKKISKNFMNPNVVLPLIDEAELLKKSIKTIQVTGKLDPLIDSINKSFNNLAKISANATLDDMQDLVQMSAEIDLFEAIYENILAVSDKATIDRFNVINIRLSKARATIKDKVVELLQDFHEDIDVPQRELDFLASNFNSMSDINHPIFETGKKLISESFGNTQRMLKDLIEEVETRKNALETWAKGRGMTLQQAYNKLINEKTGNLKGKFSPEYHETVKEKRAAQDSKWFKDNFEYSNKKAYEEDLAKYEASLEGTPESYKKHKLAVFKASHDLSSSSAWLNSYAINAYAELKNPEKHYSDSYKELALDKPLKEFYDFYVDTNKYFNSLVDDKISGNFVANIRKDLIDTIAQGGNVLETIKNTKSDFINGLKIRQNDVLKIEGEELEIPLLYKDTFSYKNKDGKWVDGTDKKNFDLTSNMVIFAEQVFNKYNMENIKGTIEGLRLLINNQKVIKTDNFGKPIIKNQMAQTGDSTVNPKVFSSMVDALVYGRRIQNKDRYIQMGDATISLNKVLTSIMSYMSIKSLSMNYVSGFGNFFGAYSNAYIKGVGGKYYNNTQMWKAHKLMMKRGENDLYNHLTKYFNVHNGHWVKDEAARLSASKLTKNLTFDKWYILQEKGDEFVVNTILVSMLQNYGLDENGSPKRLALLPEGTPSMFSKVNRANDKIEIEGLTDEGFDQFRKMVMYVSKQVKGTTNPEDISMMATTVWGKSIMHFKSWIAPMVKERFGSLDYTPEVQEWQMGRYKSIQAELFNKKFIPNMLKLGLDLVTFSKIKYKHDYELLHKQYEKWQEENPDLADKLTEEEYLDMRERALRESIHELKIMSSMFLLMLAARADFNDDGEEWYKQNAGTKQLYKILNRSYLELSFFTNPQSFRDIVKTPIPVMQVGVDLAQFGGNTLDETRDRLFGENQENDRAELFKYSKKLAPVANPLFNFLEDFETED